MINRQDFQKKMNYATALIEKEYQELAVWYNGNVVYHDKVRLNNYYYRHCAFVKDNGMILAMVIGKKIMYNGEMV